jgi:type VI secretion system protein ImpA
MNGVTAQSGVGSRARWDGHPLVQPCGGANACGPSLDAASLLAFDAFRVFGQQVALDAPLETSDDGRESERGRVPKPADSPEWLDIRARALSALARSKDLRVLAFLAAATLRIEGPYAFCDLLSIASVWLTEFWDSVHPLAADDTIERQGALSAFNDHFAIVDPLRRAPLVTSRQHGRFSLRDVDQGSGSAAADAAFDELPLADLQAAWQRVIGAQQAVAEIENRIKAADSDPVLSLDQLAAQLVRLERVLRGQVARRPESGVPHEITFEAPVHGANGASGTPAVIGVIQTRQDAVRAIEAAAAFFRQTEPSSPVPLLLDRAKRLVSKNFLEVLADLAPGALAEARVAGGVREE